MPPSSRATRTPSAAPAPAPRNRLPAGTTTRHNCARPDTLSLRKMAGDVQSGGLRADAQIGADPGVGAARRQKRNPPVPGSELIGRELLGRPGSTRGAASGHGGIRARFASAPTCGSSGAWPSAAAAASRRAAAAAMAGCPACGRQGRGTPPEGHLGAVVDPEKQAKLPQGGAPPERVAAQAGVAGQSGSICIGRRPDGAAVWSNGACCGHHEPELDPSRPRYGAVPAGPPVVGCPSIGGQMS